MVIAHTGEVGGIGDRNRWKGQAVRPVPACQLLGKVHRVAHRAAVATRDDLAAGPHGIHHEVSCAPEGIQACGIRQKGRKDIAGFFKVLSYALGTIHAGKVAVAS